MSKEKHQCLRLIKQAESCQHSQVLWYTYWVSCSSFLWHWFRQSKILFVCYNESKWKMVISLINYIFLVTHLWFIQIYNIFWKNNKELIAFWEYIPKICQTFTFEHKINEKVSMDYQTIDLYYEDTCYDIIVCNRSLGFFGNVQDQSYQSISHHYF